MKNKNVSRKKDLSSMFTLFAMACGGTMLLHMHATKLEQCRTQLISAFSVAASTNAKQDIDSLISRRCHMEREFFDEKLSKIQSGELRVIEKLMPMLFLFSTLSILLSF
jgi:hypothetical protein